jgi:hypothetical protein
MSEFYTYLYIDPSRNEPIYVGKGKGKRAKVHLKRKDMHPLTHRLRSMKEKGVTPLIIYLAEGVNEELAHLVETEAISKWGRKDLGQGPLLNLTDGGEGSSGWVMSEATKLKIATQALKRGRLSEAHKAAIGAGGIGRTGWNHTSEARAKISSSKSGKALDPEYCRLLSEKKKGMQMPQCVCPNCGKQGAMMPMKRWHFDNCRMKKHG